MPFHRLPFAIPFPHALPSPSNRFHTLPSSSRLQTLLDSSTSHVDSAEVQAGVAGALRNLSVSPQISGPIVELGGVPLLIQAANKHTANAIVLHGVAGALRNLSAAREGNKKLIIDAGGIDALDTAAMMHAQNERLLAEVSGARRNLLGQEAATAVKAPDSKRGDGSDRKKLKKQGSKTKVTEGNPLGGAPLASQRANGAEEKEKKSTVRPSFGGLSRRAKPKK